MTKARIAPRSAFSRSAAGIADALLVFFPALSIATQVRLPRLSDSNEVVSATTRAGFESLSNYAQLGICAILVWGAFALGYRRGRPLLQWVAESLAERVRGSSRLRALAWVLIAAALVVYVVNISSSAITGPLDDGFHEGEYLGFVPVLASGMSALASTFTVHGPGVDLLPAFITARFGGGDNGIVLTRVGYATLRSLAVVASMLVVLVLVKLVSPRYGPSEWAASAALAFMFFNTALQIGAWPDELALHKTVNARDTAFLLQVLVVLMFAASQRTPRARWPGLALAATAGASLPWAIFYSYDRGLYGIAFVVLASIAFGLCGGKWARTWLAGLMAGAAIGVFSLYAIVGQAGALAVAGQVGYWIRHGRDIWSFSGIAISASTWAGVLLAGAFIGLALGAVRVMQAKAAEGGLREAFRQQIAVVILCAASIPPLRMAVERGDAGHVAWGVTPAWILLAVLVASFALEAIRRAPRPGDPAPDTGDANFTAPLLLVAISALVGANVILFNPVAAFHRIDHQYFAGLRITDRQLLSPGQIATMDSVAGDLRSSPCFFTLTSESAWYYLLRKESCSRFYQVTNARPLAAQREVVAALQSRPPALVLFSSGGWSNSIDGVSVFNANPIVARHVLSHYLPDKVVADNWFWRRSDESPRFADRRLGVTTSAPSTAVQAWDARISGEYRAQGRTPPPQALFVTAGDANTPIWAGRPDREELGLDRWSAMVPTAALAKGKHRLRVWAFYEKGTPMIQLGEDVELQIT